jgi:heptosyltransferase II
VPRSAHNPGRVLVIRFSAIGDVLLATPLVRTLKTSHPQASIDFLTKKSYVSLIETNRRVDKILAFSPETGFGGLLDAARGIRKNRYDAVIDLQGNWRSVFLSLFSGAEIRSRAKLNRFRRFLLVRWKWDTYGEIVPVPVRYMRASPIPVKDDGRGLDLPVPAEAVQSVREAWRKLGFRRSDRVVALAPGAGRKTKQWPAERFAEIGRALSKRGFKIILIGGGKDGDACARTGRGMRRAVPDFSGKWSLLETAAALQRADLLVTNDTGVMHMASALGTRVVAIFGPTTRHFGFMPFRANAVVVEKELDCRPCSYHGTERCPRKHFKCMRDITGEEVLDRIIQLLNVR